MESNLKVWFLQSAFYGDEQRRCLRTFHVVLLRMFVLFKGDCLFVFVDRTQRGAFSAVKLLLWLSRILLISKTVFFKVWNAKKNNRASSCIVIIIYDCPLAYRLNNSGTASMLLSRTS